MQEVNRKDREVNGRRVGGVREEGRWRIEE